MTQTKEERRAKEREADRRRYAADPEKVKARVRAWQEANKDKVKARNSRNYFANKEKYAANVRKWRAENRERARATERRRIGLPEPIRPCPKFCECCGGSPGKKSLALDHSHEAHEFRGWLCGKCNTGIGSLGDSIAGLECAIAYLRRAETQKPPITGGFKERT